MAVAPACEQRKMAAALRDKGKPIHEIAAELQRRYGVGGLAACRQANGWSQVETCDRWHELWPERPIGQSTLSGWERWPIGGRQPSLVTLGRLARLYRVSVSDLLSRYEDHRPRPMPGELTARYREGVAPKLTRRQAMRVAAGAAGVAAAGHATDAAATPRGRIGATDVERLREEYWSLWHADQSKGGAAVFQATLATLDRVNSLLDQGTFRPSIGRNLQSLAGALAELAGFCAFDSGNQDRADHHFAEALTIARVADDDQLAVQTMAQWSHAASFNGQGRLALDVAQAAQRIARGFSTHRLAALLASREAVGHGMRDDAAAAQAALRRAEDELADADAEEQPGAWYGYFSVLDLEASAARTWVLLGAPVAAERCARRTVEDDRVAPRARAAYCARWAGTLVASGRLDEAAAAATRAVELSAGLRSHRVATDLAALRPAFNGHETVPGVAEAIDALAGD